MIEEIKAGTNYIEYISDLHVPRNYEVTVPTGVKIFIKNLKQDENSKLIIKDGGCLTIGIDFDSSKWSKLNYYIFKNINYYLSIKFY